ncbi:Poly [ADP-ribose] polymerase 1 [Penicillium rolfsii]|nr:Poly [ADP-ribose] polymerase 1 [Penicillium rolfsii]
MTAAVKPISKKIENQFERLVISASGKIPDYNHGDKQAMVEECGAKFERMNIGECTHLITTAECYHGENVPAKIIKAQKSASCDIVSIDWLLASTKAKAPLNTRDLLIRALGSKRLVSTSSNSNPKPARKRKLSIGSSQSPRQRRKGENDRVLANRDKLSALVDKASNAGDTGKNLCVWTDKNDIVYDATMVENLSASASPAKSETTSVKIIQIQLIVDILSELTRAYCLLQVLNVFRIKRLREAMQFSRWREDYKSVLSERRLLWHGSMVSNFAGILRHGFHIGPSKGIFFADWAEKSVSFCRVTKGNNAFMLLCEVEFGRVSGQWGAGDSFIHDGLSHTTWSDAASVHPDLKGVIIPDVHPKDNTNAFTKEYVVMNPAQIRQRYIFHFKLN